MTDFRKLLCSLVEAKVAFVVIGGLAVISHGHVRLTADLDLCYARSSENLERLAAALLPLHPSLRGAPAGLPFVLDARTLRSGLNFTLMTDAGAIDLLGEVTGIGMYEELAPSADQLVLYGHSVHVLSLELLERSKVAAGRPKDLFDLEALAAIRRRNSAKSLTLSVADTRQEGATFQPLSSPLLVTVIASGEAITKLKL